MLRWLILIPFALGLAILSGVVALMVFTTLIPDMGTALVGAVLTARLVVGPVSVGPAVLDVQSLLLASTAVVVGVQALLFAVLSRTYAAGRGMLPPSGRLHTVDHPQALERGAGVGALLIAAGVVGVLVSVTRWAGDDFGPLDASQSLRLAIPSALALSLYLRDKVALTTDERDAVRAAAAAA